MLRWTDWARRSDRRLPGILIPYIFSYCAHSSLPLYISDLASGTSPLPVMPMCLVTDQIRGSEVGSYILEATIFSEPMSIPSLHLTPIMVLLTKVISDHLLRHFHRLLGILNLEDLAVGRQRRALVVKLKRRVRGRWGKRLSRNLLQFHSYLF